MASQRQLKKVFKGMEPLESRVLFDAVVDVGCGVDCPEDIPIAIPDVEEEKRQIQHELPLQLVLIDSAVMDADRLVASITSDDTAQFEIRFLDEDQNGVSQVTNILKGSQSRFDSIHILSHGESGAIQLGDGWIGTDELSQYADEIAGWSETLTEDGDVLFYGCDLAGDKAGEDFVNKFRHLTGADVAASIDVTGHESLNGDWDLEFTLGEIDTTIFATSDFRQTLGPGEIVGTINDVTYDGAGGVAGLNISAFDNDNNLAGTTTSDVNGDYIISGLTDAQKYRVVFSNAPDGFESASVDSNESGSVVFGQAGSTNVDFNVHRPLEYCESNPEVAVSCYIMGTHDGQASDMAAIVSVEHDFDPNSPKTVLATIGQIGSTYGMAYQSDSDLIYSASFLKRNSGFGPEGMDAIYLIAGTNGGYANTSDASRPIAIHLSDFGIDVGAELSSADRGLSDDPTELVLDQWGWDNQFRIGLGDIDISEDGDTLYVMNLNDHDGNGTHGQLVILDISDPTNVSLKGTVDIPNLVDGVADVDLRAFATKFSDGHLYIGVTGTAESTQDRADLKSAVYQLDVNESAFNLVAIDSSHVYGGTSGPKDHIALDYDRSNAYELGSDVQSADFQPWTNDASLYDESSGFLSRPQALLTDIEFDVDGSIVLAFANRDAYQLGDFDIYPGGGTETRPGLIAGEILRVQKTATGYELEGGTAAPSNATGADNLGPNGGEYYFRENFFSLHRETSMGSLALLPGSGEVVMTMADPIGVHSGGLSRLNNSTGGSRSDIELYNLGIPGSAAKGAGLGDLEIICRAAPVEIGNYIWFDADADGVQDAGESALNNVLVGLYDDTGTLTATVETDSSGRYLFSSEAGTNVNQDGDGIDEMAYGLAICNEDCTYTVGVLDSNYDSGGALDGFTVTVSDQFGTANDWTDHSDSDAVLVNVGSDLNFASQGVTLTTTGAGTNNHTFDFGFITADTSTVDPVVPPVEPPVLPPVIAPPILTAPAPDPIVVDLTPLILAPSTPLVGGCPIQHAFFREVVEPCEVIETCEVVATCESFDPCEQIVESCPVEDSCDVIQSDQTMIWTEEVQPTDSEWIEEIPPEEPGLETLEEDTIEYGPSILSPFDLDIEDEINEGIGSLTVSGSPNLIALIGGPQQTFASLHSVFGTTSVISNDRQEVYSFVVEAN